MCAADTVTMNLNELRVPMLKAQLLARDRDARGTKAVLVGRLRDALLVEGVAEEQFVSELLGASSAGPCRVRGFASGQSSAPGMRSRDIFGRLRLRLRLRGRISAPAPAPAPSKTVRRLRLRLRLREKCTGSGGSGSGSGSDDQVLI